MAWVWEVILVDEGTISLAWCLLLSIRRLGIAASAYGPPRNDILNIICHRERSDAISSGVASSPEVASRFMFTRVQSRQQFAFLLEGCQLGIAASLAALPPRNDTLNTICHRERSDAISSGVPSASLLVVRGR